MSNLFLISISLFSASYENESLGGQTANASTLFDTKIAPCFGTLIVRLGKEQEQIKVGIFLFLDYFLVKLFAVGAQKRV